MEHRPASRLRLAALFLQGMLIGTGAILPGISGGVLCMAFGLYEPMVELFVRPVQALRRNWRLFIPVILGGGVGFLLLARAVELLLTVAAVETTALFTGLICGTIPGLMKKSGSKVARMGDPGWAGFIISLMLSFLFFCMLEDAIPGALEPNFAWYVFCGAIWATSMLLPGLSSSSVILFLGLYEPMAHGIGHLDFSVILPLMLGFVVTLLLCARGVDRLMKRHYAQMLRVLLGFVISSTLTILPISFTGPAQFAAALACMAAGFAVAYWMEGVQKPDEAED